MSCGDPVSHRCTVGNGALHIDFTVCDHHAIYLEKCFFSFLWRIFKGPVCVCGGTFEAMNMQMDTQREPRVIDGTGRSAFTLGKGKAWD